MPLKFKPGILICLGVLALAACNSRKSDDTALDSATAAGAASAAPEARHATLLAAAEPFEALTEQAGTATPEKLKSLISDAQAAASGVKDALGTAQRGALDGLLSDISAAGKQDDRTGIALASVEGYRALVESAPDTGPVPLAVSLLDYAGFRYQADLVAAPVRWKDAMTALDFADSQWAGLGARITDTALREEFAKSLEAMRSAAEAKDLAAAKGAVTHELDVVDKLEQHFSQKP